MFSSPSLGLRLSPAFLAMATRGQWFSGRGCVLRPSSPAMEGHPLPSRTPCPPPMSSPFAPAWLWGASTQTSQTQLSRLTAVFPLSSPLGAGGQGDGVMREVMGDGEGESPLSAAYFLGFKRWWGSLCSPKHPSYLDSGASPSVASNSWRPPRSPHPAAHRETL